LKTHLRRAEPCLLRKPVIPGEGINEKQKQQLQARKRGKHKGGTLTEEAKWREVFKILFKDHNPERIPSPRKLTTMFVIGVAEVQV
jgi:hypothetical protein